MRRPLVQLVFCFLVCSLFACAIVKERLKTPTPEPPVRAQLPDPLVPEIKDVAYVIKFDGAGEADINLQKGDNTEAVADEELKRLLLQGPSKNNGGLTAAPADAVVIIEPTGTDKFEAIAQVIRGARRAFTSKIKVRISDGVYAFVRTDWGDQIPPGPPVKPDPMTLIVVVDAAGNLLLNREPTGTLSKPIRLRELLERVFQSRADNGVFRPGTDILERTVQLRLPPSMNWKDASGLIRTVREAGADPIGLLVTDLEK